MTWMRRGCAVAVVVVLAFTVRRVLIDFPGLGAAVTPSAEDGAYAAHRLLAYAHIAPGVVYLAGGAVQLTARIRRRHPALHRRLGRVVLPCGLVSGAFAIAFAVPHAYGGPLEVAATICFGTWFELCLVLAYVGIRRGRVDLHRRWMVRGYATASAVGTIRVLMGLLVVPVGLVTSFGLAFWAAFVIHTVAAEHYLRRAPVPPG